MSYADRNIREVVSDIDQKKIYLPALQRKFVWGKRQIELLFDSLMRNYPIGTFLFWRLHRQKAESYVFYEFLTEYDERNPYNRRKTGAFLHEEIIGVLDGQQRLSSMYIGLMGTHTEKTPYKHSSNPEAFEKTCLYLNLLSLPYTIDIENNITIIEEKNFEFLFLTDEKAKSSTMRKVEMEDKSNREEHMFWMKVGQVLSWPDDPEYDKIIEDHQKLCQTDDQKEEISRQKRIIKKGLETLYYRIRRDRIINYFEIAKDDLEDILKIFVRVNSGGTVLNKTDLLFSTIVATWDEGREQIEGLLKEINAKGDGFNFSNEYLMRCCLVLSDGPVLYKVNSFKSENVEQIRKDWPRIAEAIKDTVDLLVEFGFSGSVLTSLNATILIAYYLYKGGDKSKQSKLGMRKYLIHSLLNGIYGASQDQLITTLRSAFREEKTGEGSITYRLKDNYRSFSFEEVLTIPLPQQKSLAVDEDDIERFLKHKKGPSSFFVLSLLYPDLRYSEVKFHQDHIHPSAGFTESLFRDLGIPKDQWQEWLDYRDSVPNLQLMEGRQNESKNATPLKDWLEQQAETYQNKFINDNYLPENASLEFKDFMLFFNQRKEKLREKLREVLAISSDRPLVEEEIWNNSDEESEVLR